MEIRVRLVLSYQFEDEQADTEAKLLHVHFMGSFCCLVMNSELDDDDFFDFLLPFLKVLHQRSSIFRLRAQLKSIFELILNFFWQSNHNNGLVSHRCRGQTCTVPAFLALRGAKLGFPHDEKTQYHRGCIALNLRN